MLVFFRHCGHVEEVHRHGTPCLCQFAHHFLKNRTLFKFHFIYCFPVKNKVGWCYCDVSALLQVMSLSPAPLSLLIKAAPILTDDMYGDVQPAAWELLLSVDEHMAAAAGKSLVHGPSQTQNDPLSSRWWPIYLNKDAHMVHMCTKFLISALTGP